MTHLPKDVLQICRQRLLTMKSELMNRLNKRWDLSFEEKVSGDEIDQAVAQRLENIFALQQQHVRMQLMDVEMALQRMLQGTYGICEETEEPIEVERLLALPSTKLSIEGAELREAFAKKYIRPNTSA